MAGKKRWCLAGLLILISACSEPARSGKGTITADGLRDVVKLAFAGFEGAQGWEIAACAHEVKFANDSGESTRYRLGSDQGAGVRLSSERVGFAEAWIQPGSYTEVALTFGAKCVEANGSLSIAQWAEGLATFPTAPKTNPANVGLANLHHVPQGYQTTAAFELRFSFASPTQLGGTGSASQVVFATAHFAEAIRLISRGQGDAVLETITGIIAPAQAE
ncbi:MAG: hypothetical protein AB7P04_06865 [Bacteriovoracia bacterium]